MLFALQAYMDNILAGRNRPYLQVWVPWLICSYLWAAATPLVLWLARRFPIERERLLRRVGVHLIVGSFVSALQLITYVGVSRTFFAPNVSTVPLSRALQGILIGEFHINLLIYFVLVGLFQTLDYYRRFRERERRAKQLELEAVQLEAQLTRAQLDALKMQLHPHFLFNTLNTISVLMQEDPVAANQTRLRLSELLRISLTSGDTDEVTLRRELAFLQSYLEIERTRFQDRLKIEINAPPETLEASVPNLILQPLVENAIRHAVAPRAEETIVRVHATRHNGSLLLEVTDNGEGMADRIQDSDGIGLANTRSRLEKIYGKDHDFRVESSGAGVHISISIPFRSHEESSRV